MLVLALPLLTRRVRSLLEALADSNARIVEYVQGAAVLRTFGRYGEGFERLRASLERLREWQVRTELGPSPLMAGYGFTVDMGFVLAALLGSHLMLGGTLTAPNLLVCLLVAAGVSRRLFDFGTGLLQLRTAQAALSRVEALLDEPALPEPPSANVRLERFDIELDAVHFAYEHEPILKSVSALLPARQLTALVGPSGAGKSTLVHLIARLWDVKRGSGAIRVGGVDIRDLPFETLHQYISLVFQDVVLFSGTILDNIRIGKPDASQREIEAAAKAAQAHEFIRRLPDGYHTVVGEGGGTLSGGEKQRISIARAILKDAPIVLLDEATASVDSFAEAELQRAIDVLVQTKTVIVIAHHLKTVQFADQILVMEKGSVVERGKHAELLAAGGLYARLWARQAAAKTWLAPQSPEEHPTREAR
jgi:ATP-binding cassette subfamily B protein